MGSFEEAPRRAGREQLKANNLWTTDPSQPPMITSNHLTVSTIFNATLKTRPRLDGRTCSEAFSVTPGDSLHSPFHRLLRACSPTALCSPTRRYLHSKSTPSLCGTHVIPSERHVFLRFLAITLDNLLR